MDASSQPIVSEAICRLERPRAAKASICARLVILTAVFRLSTIRSVVETVCRAPAKGLSRWSARTLAGHLDIPSATVNRILRENKLQPHRLRTFTFSPDPQFGEKLLEVVALYMNPPDNVVVLCMDEKTGIQALIELSRCYRYGPLNHAVGPTNMCDMGPARY